MGRAKRKLTKAVNGDSNSESTKSNAEKDGEEPEKKPRSRRTEQDGEESKTEPERTQRELRHKRDSEPESNSKEKASKSKKGSKIYEVERILEKRSNKRGEDEFLIKWKGYSDEDNSWVPRRNLYCDRLLTEFLNSLE